MDMSTIAEPKPGEQWRLRSDPTKILTVKWTNTRGYVRFSAPWMTKCKGCTVETFHKRYVRA